VQTSFPKHATQAEKTVAAMTHSSAAKHYRNPLPFFGFSAFFAWEFLCCLQPEFMTARANAPGSCISPKPSHKQPAFRQW
jgi:hypothetical protein